MKIRDALMFCVPALCLSLPARALGGGEKIPIRVLIVPKLEIGEITGDFPGEAQLFYEGYCAGCSTGSSPCASS